MTVVGRTPAPTPKSDEQLKAEGLFPDEDQCDEDDCHNHIRYKMVYQRDGNAAGRARRFNMSFVCREHRGSTYDRGYEGGRRCVAKRYGVVKVPRIPWFTKTRWWNPLSWFKKYVWNDSDRAKEVLGEGSP